MGHLVHICSNIYLKPNRKLSALTRVVKFVPFFLKKRRVLIKAFIELQSKYFSLVWMFHGSVFNDRINTLHERMHLRIHTIFLSQTFISNTRLKLAKS